MNNTYISTSALYGPYLAHHGIKGQKWGIRRYQNEDGTLTAEGYKRYKTSENFNRILEGKNLSDKEAKQRYKLKKQYERDYEENWYIAHNGAALIFNDKIGDLNSKWSKVFDGYDNWMDSPKYQEYEDAVTKMFDDLYDIKVNELFGKIS